MHTNRIIDRIDLKASDLLNWTGSAGDEALRPVELSHGQRQDLALALFLARARSLEGPYFLDEPMAHLDDLNRVGLLDAFRALALEGNDKVNLVVTTASRAVMRHMHEKFSRVDDLHTLEWAGPALQIVELRGNSRRGLERLAVG